MVDFGHPYAVLRPVRSGNAFEETIEHLLQAIKVGLFPKGDKLPPERELAVHLGVSRATLRDALAELQRAGFIEVRRGRYGGTYILDSPTESVEKGEILDPEACHDALVFRSVVEPAAAELAATASLSAPARQHLQSCLADVLEADESTYRTRDARFHIAVAELSNCPSLVAAVTDARARASALLDQIPLLSANLAHSNQQHVALAESILQGNPARARSLMADHLEGTASLLRGFMP
ncbi:MULTISPECIES: FadR/GntR family transcriptional regulator [Kocuria]|uniref:FadR/GntR family transcriptional regulator n=1 Tax=Kocuria TaxID=57493 RepID=UPI0013DDF985|nr:MULTISPECIES: GntR family transcriptional regulator [Kocuria]MCT2170471.1 GntR family transcriptional regulator [Kocuria rhizophila]MDN3462714.1 GntR family transcriptional regulator [Kocuria sp. APC 4018]